MLSLKFLYKSPLGSLVTGWRQKNNKSKKVRGDIPDFNEDAARAAYVRSIPRAQWFGGVLLQGYLVHQDVLKGIEDFEIRDDDVFIITYPKSGTTWTEEIVSLVYHDGDPDAVRNKLLAYRVEHLEVGRPLGHLRHLRKIPSPRLMATHLPLPLIPKQLRQGNSKGHSKEFRHIMVYGGKSQCILIKLHYFKHIEISIITELYYKMLTTDYGIIYVVRNPKDNAVSYYHHHRMSTFLGNFKGSWDEFLYLYMKGYLVYGSWFDHVLPYWKFCQEHPDRMLFISFEELKLDLPGMVSKISTFLGRPLTPEAIAAISNHCTFEQMKNNNMVNREVLPIPDLFDMTQSKFMRKGIIGDWKNYFTEEQNIEFTKLYNEKMKDSNLELLFDPEEIDNRNNNGEMINKTMNSEKSRQILNGNINNMKERET